MFWTCINYRLMQVWWQVITNQNFLSFLFTKNWEHWCEKPLCKGGFIESSTLWSVISCSWWTCCNPLRTYVYWFINNIWGYNFTFSISTKHHWKCDFAWVCYPLRILYSLFYDIFSCTMIVSQICLIVVPHITWGNIFQFILNIIKMLFQLFFTNCHSFSTGVYCNSICESIVFHETQSPIITSDIICEFFYCLFLFCEVCCYHHSNVQFI